MEAAKLMPMSASDPLVKIAETTPTRRFSLSARAPPEAPGLT